MTKNMTEGRPIKLIVFFTIPLLIGNIFQQLYSMADALIVGRTVGVGALAAVGCTGSITFLIIGFAQGLSMGLSVVMAQRFGAGDYKGVRKSFTASLVISLVVTIILTAIGLIFSESILKAMNTPADIIGDAKDYLMIIFAGTVVSILFNLLSNIIRALGDSKTPLIFLVAACILNIILDYTFILLFHMGVSGAAYATVLAQLIASILCIFYIARRFPVLHIKKEDWKIDAAFYQWHLNVGLPMGFQFSIIAIGAIVLQVALNRLGTDAVAAYTAAGKIDQLASMPANSFGATMATYVAQNFGAGRLDRIKKGVRDCCFVSAAVSILMGGVNILFGSQLIRLFVDAGEENVIFLAKQYLVIMGVTYFILALLFIYRNALQGLGKSLAPTVAGVMELVMRIFAAMVLSAAFGFAGACLANPLAWVGACVPLGINYYYTMKKLETNK